MGLPQYRRQLYVRPSYLQLRALLAQLVQVASQYADKLRKQSVRLVVNLVSANHSVCALYSAIYFLAQGSRVVSEFHLVSAAGPTIWYHFPFNSSQGFLEISAVVGKRSSFTQMMLRLFGL